jgi:hypothetical protein
MTVKDLFKQIDNANAFKALIGEGAFYKITIFDEEPLPQTIATVATYKEYKKAIHEYYIPTAEEELKNAEIVKTSTNREFKVITADGNIKLYID